MTEAHNIEEEVIGENCEEDQASYCLAPDLILHVVTVYLLEM